MYIGVPIYPLYKVNTECFCTCVLYGAVYTTDSDILIDGFGSVADSILWLVKTLASVKNTRINVNGYETN